MRPCSSPPIYDCLDLFDFGIQILDRLNKLPHSCLTRPHSILSVEIDFLLNGPAEFAFALTQQTQSPERIQAKAKFLLECIVLQAFQRSFDLPFFIIEIDQCLPEARFRRLLAVRNFSQQAKDAIGRKIELSQDERDIILNASVARFCPWPNVL
jgi:hypothetical protein